MWGPTMREHVKYEFENLFRHILMKLAFCKCDFEKRIQHFSVKHDGQNHIHGSVTMSRDE